MVALYSTTHFLSKTKLIFSLLLMTQIISKLDVLTAKARAIGKDLHEVDRDGNCFYRAVCHQVGSVDHTMLRLQVANWILHRPSLFMGFLSGSTDIPSFVNDIRHGKEAENIAMKATSDLLNATIHILRSDSDPTVIEPTPGPANSIVFLGYVPAGSTDETSGHYYSMVNSSTTVSRDSNSSPAEPSARTKADLSPMCPTIPSPSCSAEGITINQSGTKLKDNLSDFCHSLPSGFNLMALNVQGLCTNRHADWKLEEIRHALIGSRLSVLALTETWLKVDPPAIGSYQVFHKNRAAKSHGGLVVYVSDKLKAQIRDELTLMNTGKIETLWLDLSYPKSKSFLFGCVYRPPNCTSEDLELFEHQVEAAQSQCGSIILAGDFNIDLLQTKDSQKLEHMRKAFDLTQLISEPTRVTTNSCTLIDHIWVNTSEKKFTKVSKVITTGLSDHDAVYFNRKRRHGVAANGRVKTIFYRNLRNFDTEAFREQVTNANWNTVYNSTTVDEALDHFQEILTTLFDTHIPTRKKRIRHSSPAWLTSELLQVMRIRDCSKKKAKNTGLQDDWDEYKKLRNECTRQVRYAKSHFYSSIIGDEMKINPRKAWKQLKGLLLNEKNSAPITSLVADQVSVTGHAAIAETFAKFFCGVADGDPPDQSDSTAEVTTHANDFTIPEMSADEVKNALKVLPLNKATGMDGLSVKLLRLCGGTIIQPLQHVINLSIKCATFPSSWKQAQVTPVFKKGEVTNPSNYRPIAVLPACSKILERHVASHLRNHIAANGLLHDNQSGFRPSYSCATALLSMVGEWLSAIDSGHLVGVLLTDFSKAFDTISHRILLRTVHQKYHFSAAAQRWLSSYLSNRQIRVKVDATLSSAWTLPAAGVPQGSVLGPILFALYIDSLPDALLPHASHLFADDATTWEKGKTVQAIEPLLETGMQKLANWAQQNRVKLNASKCTTILLGTRVRLAMQKKKLTVPHDGTSIKTEQSSRLLGLVVDQALSFHEHIQLVCKRMNYGSHLLRKALPYLKQPLLLQLYYAFIHSHLIYCLEVWGPLVTKGDIEKIEGIRNRCAKLLLGTSGSNTLHNREDRFKKLGWLPLPKLVVYRTVLQVYKLLNCGGPTYLRQLLNPIESKTRQAARKDLRVPFRETALAQRAYSYIAPTEWNSLPDSIRRMPSISTFKKSLFDYLNSA